ncbi:MAG: chromate transporter [Alicyclobacillus sp.]|nr:chromate transporter [Alicyclobacillus sp.]
MHSQPNHPGEPRTPVSASSTCPVQGSLQELARVFLWLGLTTFGGMWGANASTEKALIERRHWLEHEELQSYMVIATVMPSPKFLALAGLVGFKLRGWLGSAVAVVTLIFPSALMVLLGTLLIPPSLLRGVLAPLQELTGVAITGILFGNALRQLKTTRVQPRQRWLGLGLTAAVFVVSWLGVPLILAAMLGLALSMLLIRPASLPAATAEVDSAKATAVAPGPASQSPAARMKQPSSGGDSP